MRDPYRALRALGGTKHFERGVCGHGCTGYLHLLHHLLHRIPGQPFGSVVVNLVEKIADLDP